MQLITVIAICAVWLAAAAEAIIEIHAAKSWRPKPRIPLGKLRHLLR